MKIALYSSIGNNIKSFLSYFHYNLSNRCDLFLNFYGNNDSIFNELTAHCSYIGRQYTTKFPSLKIAYLNSTISDYDYVLVLDDDFVVEKGDLFHVINVMSQYNLDIASACHSNSGKVSHHIMRHHEGDHIFRYTNFVEMNFPIFSKNGLYKYMQVYDGNLCGWGNDWWYLNVLNCNAQKNCGIIDNVCIKNPYNHEKSGNIDSFMTRNARHEQWKTLQHQMNLHQWNMKNIEFVHE